MSRIENTPGGELPKSLFGYDVVDFIGEGAGSVIYQVSDPVHKKQYALKHVVRSNDKDIRFVEQLEVEYEIGRKFTHSGLRKSVDLKVYKSLLRKVTEAYLLMELFDGQPLETALPNSLASIMKTFLASAKALQSLHALGYVHCDLKPNNILLAKDGSVKVIDFGQACPVGTTKPRIQGTPDFIAPEQVRCEAVTPRTDVFNYGATLYWALTLRKLPTLFTLKKSENSFLVDDVMAAPNAVNPRIPDPISNFVMECVRTNPAKRPQDMAEVTRRMEVLTYAVSQRAKSVPA